MSRNEAIPVTIHLETVRDDGETRDEITSQANGRLYKKTETWFITYEDELEVGTVTNTIKLQHDHATVIRHGAVSMRQAYTTARATEGSYYSPYGKMPMTATTKALDFSWHDDRQEGSLHLAYHLEMSGQPVGDYKMTITMKGAKQ